MPSPKFLAPALLVVGGIAVGAGVMFYLQRPPEPMAVSQGSTHPATQNTTLPLPSPTETGATDNGRPVMSVLGEALQTTDRDKRLTMLRELAERLFAKDLKLALETGAKIPDANDRMEFMRALFAAWGTKDPKAAADYAKANFKAGLMLGETLNAVVEKWAGLDPKGAREWIEANTAGPLKEEAMGMLVQGWTRHDPAGASAWFVATGSTSQTLLNALVTTWATSIPKAPAAWVESLANAENKTLGRIVLAQEWADRIPPPPPPISPPC